MLSFLYRSCSSVIFFCLPLPVQNESLFFILGRRLNVIHKYLDIAVSGCSFFIPTKVRKQNLKSVCRAPRKWQKGDSYANLSREGGSAPLATLVPRGLYPSALQSSGLQYQECLSGAKTSGERVRNELFFSAEIRSAYTCRASWGYGLKVAQAGSTKARGSEETS